MSRESWVVGREKCEGAKSEAKKLNPDGSGFRFAQHSTLNKECPTLKF